MQDLIDYVNATDNYYKHYNFFEAVQEHPLIHLKDVEFKHYRRFEEIPSGSESIYNVFYEGTERLYLLAFRFIDLLAKIMVKVAIQLPYHSLVAVLQLLKDSYFIVHVCCQLMYDLYFDEDQSFRSSNNVSQWYRLFLSQNDLSQDKPLIESNTERAIWFQKLGYFLVYSFGSRIVQAIIDQLSIAASLIHVIVISSCDLCLMALELLYGLNQILPIIPSLYWIIRMMQTNEYLGIPYIYGYSDEDGHLDLDKHPVSVTFSYDAMRFGELQRFLHNVLLWGPKHLPTISIEFPSEEPLFQLEFTIPHQTHVVFDEGKEKELTKKQKSSLGYVFQVYVYLAGILWKKENGVRRANARRIIGQLHEWTINPTPSCVIDLDGREGVTVENRNLAPRDSEQTYLMTQFFHDNFFKHIDLEQFDDQYAQYQEPDQYDSESEETGLLPQ